ncbi:hypothetical protein NOR_07184 [Metarhizium rileyi]|uniref:RNase MRP protein 1 RNA binding domain-containing protein n=1 Tax=Metarhizium rileyi (strain RCEF 4871) TaxID=1649241 RepID=A0A166Z2K0_METRR|nr:hypothetical protein NOR_07184 [Metarhizium rileyi RCEF 4871]TWU73289.1 hypothetical protein ED733_003339 [Metarhizium rileyi]
MAHESQFYESQRLRKLPSIATSSHGQTSPSTHAARATLAAVIPLLNAFNHRHHNQHRVSHWWAAFGQFRRSLRCLAERLDQQQRLDNRLDRTEPAVIALASWLDTHALPRAFHRFSQLAADNQHAPLGLFLLAVLGQIHGVLPGLLPRNAADAKASAQKPPNPPLPNYPSVADAQHTDKGVAIPRETTVLVGDDAVTPQSKKRNRDDAKPDAKGTAQNGSGKDKKRAKKKKKRTDDELSSLFGSLS